MKNDNELYTKVSEKLQFEPTLDESNITIAIKDNSIVVLGGKVKSYAEKYIAEEALKRIKNVRAIANELEVDLAATYTRSDADIAQSALNALYWNIFIPSESIKVVVEKGYLTLSGEVSTFFQKERAEKAVRDIVGVKSITNSIIVKSSINPSDVKKKITQEFERNARIDASQIQVETRGNSVEIKGSVRNFDEKEEAIRAAWSIPGVTSVIDSLRINW